MNQQLCAIGTNKKWAHKESIKAHDLIYVLYIHHLQCRKKHALHPNNIIYLSL